jgi:hypothetical protein
VQPVQGAAGVQAHIAGMKERRDGLEAQARPPQAVIQAALANPEMVASRTIRLAAEPNTLRG